MNPPPGMSALLAVLGTALAAVAHEVGLLAEAVSNV